MGEKYIAFRDGENKVIDTEGEILKLACCDCGLVHFMKITVLDDSVIRINFIRDKAATGQVRRHRYGS